MELLFLILLLGGLLLLLQWLSNLGVPDDNREPYLREPSGAVLALYVAGPVGDVPTHERFIHDGTAHQNPAVRSYTGTRWILLFPFPEEREERYYPLTNNGNSVDLNALRQRIAQVPLRRAQKVELVTMPRWAEREAIRREHGEQLSRGVPGNKVRKRGL